MATLTKDEKAWVKRLNTLLANCPSSRIAFATTGNCDVTLFDVTRYDEVCHSLDHGGGEFSSHAEKLGAAFDEHLRFPNPVESTAG